MTGDAVNVTVVSLQTGLNEATIDKLTGESGVSSIRIELDVAGLPDGHAVLEFNMQVTISPSTGLYEKKGLLTP